MLKDVVAAYIELNDKFLIAQRANGKFKGLWEFPGGKVESGESDERAIEREIKEELDIIIKAHELIGSTRYPMGDKELLLKLYRCVLSEGYDVIRLNAHTDAKFISQDEINDYEFCPADYNLLTYIRKNDNVKKRVLSQNCK